MTKNNSTPSFLCLALLLASPLAGAEGQYPAADFEPVIITRDADLIAKHSQAAKERAAALQAMQGGAKSTGTVQQAQAGTGSNSENGRSKQEDSSMENFPIALIIVALAGFVFWSSKRSAAGTASSSASAPAFVAAPAGDTGVARYVRALEEEARKAAGTGVSRYLKSLELAVKAQTPAPAAAAAPAPTRETGVSKYLKTRAG